MASAKFVHIFRSPSIFNISNSCSVLVSLSAVEEYFCEHGVNVAQSIKVWSTDYRLGSTGSATAKANSMTSLKRLEHCHGQPGSVLSAHEVIDGRPLLPRVTPTAPLTLTRGTSLTSTGDRRRRAGSRNRNVPRRRGHAFVRPAVNSYKK